LFGGRRPRGQAKARPRPAFFRPNFERLEDRLAPATRVWNGASTLSANWSDAANWVGKVVPQSGDDLVFPGGAAQLATTDDLGATPGSSVLPVNSITIDAAGYTFAQGSNGGTPVTITLFAGGLTLNSAAGSGSDTFSVPILLGASASITDTYAGVALQLTSVDTAAAVSGFTLTVAGSGSVTVPNGITHGGSLVKTGPGTLLVPSTSTYTGSTTISAGVLTLAAGANLGSGVTVASGATLQLAAGATLQQSVTLNGSGVGGGFVNSTAGALEALGTSAVNGTITLLSDSTIGVDAGILTVALNPVALATHVLTVNAATGATATFTKALTGGVGNAGSLVVNSALTSGTVTLNAASTFAGATTVDGGTLDLGGTAGSLVSNSITVNQGATLLLDNSSATSPNRIPSAAAAAVTLYGGTLTLLGGANAVTETANVIKLTGGQSNIRVNQGAGKLLTVLQAGSLVRSTGATVNFSSSNKNLGTANDEVLFTTAPATTAVTNGNILPYATVGDTDLASYVANGVAAFSGYIVNPTTFNPSTDAGNVVEFTASSTLPIPTSGLTFTAAGLVIKNATLIVPVGVNLTLANGGLLMNNASIIPAGALGGNMTFSAEGAIFSNTSAGTNSITLQITGKQGLDFAGPVNNAANTANYLYLNPGTARNVWTGGTWLDSANVGVAGSNPLGASTLTVVGGALASGTGPGAAGQVANFLLTNVVVLASANTTLDGNNLTLSGAVGLVGNSVLTVLQPATLAGVVGNNVPGTPGGLVELGTSTLTLQPGLGRGANTYTGSTVVGGGTLALATPTNPLGTGTLVLTGTATSGTTLQNTVAGLSLINALVLSNPAVAAGNQNAIITGSNFTFAHPVTLTGLTTLQVNAPVTISGAISGAGGLSQGGAGSLVLTGNNNYTGATMLTRGSLTVNGSQASSPVAVIGGTLTGNGTTGLISVGPSGEDIPSNPTTTPASQGIQTAPAANFSEGGFLGLQITGFTKAGTDYGRLNLGSGPLVVGGDPATAPSSLVIDLNGLPANTPGIATGAILYGSRLGTQPLFEQLLIVNNPNDYAASLSYTPTGLNVIITQAVNTKADAPPKTTDIWTGASTVTNRWSDPANWAANALPRPNDDLVFPAGAAQVDNFNDLTAGTGFNSITLETGGYTLSGNAINLSAGLTTTEPTDAVAPIDTINLPITLAGTFSGAETTFLSTYPGTTLVLTGAITASGSDLVVDGTGTTTITSQISGGNGVTKNGAGTLNLWPLVGSAGNSFTGVSNLNAGITTVNNATSLGVGVGTALQVTQVNSGATLETVGTNPLVLGQKLLLNGSGVGGGAPGTSLAALDVNNTGSLSLTGGVSVLSNATIDNPTSAQFNVNTNPIVLQNTVLNLNTVGPTLINQPIQDTAGNTSGGFIVNAGLTPGTGTAAAPNQYNGTVTLTAVNTYPDPTVVYAGTLDLTGAATLASTDIELDTSAAQSAPDQYPGPIGILKIDDSGNNIARLAGATGVITFNGGEFTMTGKFNNHSTEVVGHINLGKGQSFVNMNPSGPSGIVEFDFDHITRNLGTTIDFSGAGMGGTQNIALFTNAAAPALDSSNNIFPYITVTVPGKPTTYATYLQVGTTKTWQVSPFSGYLATTNPALLNGSLVGEVPAGKTLTIPAGTTTTVAALWVQGGATVDIQAGATLELLSGLLTSGGGTAVIAPDLSAGSSPDPTLTLGSAFGNEGIIISYTQTKLQTVIGDDAIANAPIGVTFGGTSDVQLAPPTDGNSYSGATYINSGSITLETDNTPFGNPAKSTLHLFSGVLAFDTGAAGLASTTATIANNLAMSGGNAEILAKNLGAGQSLILFLGDPNNPATLTLTGTNVLAIPRNTEVVIEDQVTGTGNLTQVGGGAGTGGGYLALLNPANNYSGGTILGYSGGTIVPNTSNIWFSNLIVGGNTDLGTGALDLVDGIFEADVDVSLANALTLSSAYMILGITTAPFNSNLTFTGTVTLTGTNQVVTTNSVPPTVFSGNISGPGSLNVSGNVILSGTNSTQTGFSAATPGPLEVDGSQPNSPVPVTQSTLVGNGTVGTISVGTGGLVGPGNAAIGTLTAAGANFSNGGYLYLRVAGTTTPGTDYDRLDLSGGTAPNLVLGGTSNLVLDLTGLTITQATTVQGVILYAGRIGNVPVFNNVYIVNNPNNYAVELDYTTDVNKNPELNLVIALGAPDLPTLTVPVAPNLPTTPEDVPLTFGSGNSYGLSVSDLEGPAPYAASFLVQLSIPAGTGTLSLAAGTPDGPLAAATSLSFTNSLANINLDLAGITYTPADDFTGTFALTLKVTNEGSSALLPGPQAPPAPQLVTATVNVTVTPTSPAFSVGPNKTVPFNAAGPNSFSFSPWATGIAAEPQPASWAGKTSLAFSTSNDDPALFTAAGQPAVNPNTGALTFTLSNPLPPIQVAHVKVILSETEPDGDVDSSAPQTFTITATANAPPAVTDVIIHWGSQKASLLYMLNHDGRIDIPFANINAIDVQFSESLSSTVAASALSVLGKFYGTYALSSPVFLNSYTLEWKLTASPLGGANGDDDLTLTLNGNAVTAAGNGMHLASNFTQAFVVLVGDVNNDGKVDLNDQLKIAQNLAISYAGISYLDLVGDGHIDMSSYVIARARFGNVKH